MIRDMQETDLDEILKIEHSVQLLPWSRQMFLDCFKQGFIRLVLEEDSIVIGYIIFSTVLDEAELLTIGVHPDYQHQGFGKKLLREGLKQVQAQGAKTVFLEVAITNVHAVAFYEKNGFKRISQRKGYYHLPDGNLDAWVYMKACS